LLALDQARVSLAELRKRAVEPTVAEERRALQPLRGDEGRSGRVGACRDRPKGSSLGPREAVPPAGELLEQPPQRRTEKRQLLRLARRPFRQGRRLRRPKGGP